MAAQRDELEMAPDDAESWPDRIYDLLKQHDIRQVALVPDAGHSRLIRRCLADNGMRVVTLTTEEEGIAQLFGAWLGGEKGVLLMQSSGVGNCVNMFSLLESCRFPFLTIVTMRGEYAEFNPWQGPMGRATQGAMELMGLTVLRVEDPEQVEETVSAAADSAFLAGERVAVLLGQKLIGRKKWEEH